jgi:23S rRNA (guanosine2251-2'-O)-methyltransferase
MINLETGFMDSVILEGQIAVTAALQGSVRVVERVLIREGRNMGKLRYFLRTVREAGLLAEFVTSEAIDALATGHSHGGILAIATPRRFAQLSDLLPIDHAASIIMLDGVEDPYNLGQAIRAFYAAGVDGLVLRPREWHSAETTIVRASAGASERLPIAETESAETAATFFKQQGLQIACAAKQDAVSIYQADLMQPHFLLIGGAKRGVTRSFLRSADLVIEIPYARNFPHSLGTTASAAIFASEIMRQRIGS